MQAIVFNYIYLYILFFISQINQPYFRILSFEVQLDFLDKLREIKLTVVYEGYEPEVYWLHENKDLRFTKAFQDYAMLHPALQRYSLVSGAKK